MPDLPFQRILNVWSSETEFFTEGTAGGRGSWSPVDTTVFGDGEKFGPIGNDLYWRKIDGIWMPFKRTYDPAHFGGITWVPWVDKPQPNRIPRGTGGGAKLPGKRKFGGRSLGWEPQGVVLIRLRRVE